jgi:VCBS repeat-containing protein
MPLLNNRPPVVIGTIEVLAGEDGGTFFLSGVSNAFDPDLIDLVMVTDLPADLPPAVTWDATWNLFVIDTQHPSLQTLRAGQQVTLSITFGVTDRFDTVVNTLNITVTGTNDGAVVSGTISAEICEDASTPVSGQLTVTDIDSGEAAFLPDASPLQGAYGVFSLTASGLWSYALNAAHPAVQALAAGQSLSETFVALTVDGTEQPVTVTIRGADEPVITGTAAADVLTGTAAAEAILGLAGHDRLLGQGGGDTLDGGSGADSLYGGDGDDVLIHDASDRVQSAGAGEDTLQVARAITVNLGAADQVSGDKGTASGFEHVNAAGSAAAVVLTGSAGANRITGGAAADRLTGGKGADILTGGAGADRFVFTSLADSSPAMADRTVDFAHLIDRIDLSAIDARAGGLDNAFSFIAGAAFSANGQLRYDASTGELTADVTNDRLADLTLYLSAGLTLTAADFVL